MQALDSYSKIELFQTFILLNLKIVLQILTNIECTYKKCGGKIKLLKNLEMKKMLVGMGIAKGTKRN